MKKIRVVSLDFDGCLTHAKFWEAIDKGDDYEKSLLSTNRILLEQISKKGADELILMNGSNRQSYFLDMQNMIANKTGSAFSALNSIAANISNARPQVDKFLMADLYCAKPNGTSFNLAMDQQANADGFVSQPTTISDKSKITLLYAQMHKIASENHEDTIEFDFYDDNKEILRDVVSFFTEYSDLIPKNLNLNIHCYNGELHVPTTFKNTNADREVNFTDFNYKSNIKMLAKLCGCHLYGDKKFDFTILRESMDDFLKQRDTTLVSDMKSRLTVATDEVSEELEVRVMTNMDELLLFSPRPMETPQSPPALAVSQFQFFTPKKNRLKVMMNSRLQRSDEEENTQSSGWGSCFCLK